MSTLLRDRSVIKQFIPAIIIFFTIFAVLPGLVRGQPITEGFNAFTDSVRPADWTFSGCNANSDTYTGASDSGVAPPSIMLDADGDYIQAPLDRPDELTFWVKGMGTDATSALLVEEYYSGGGWNTLTNVTTLPAIGTNFGPYSMDFSATEARFTFHTGTAGNVAFDDVIISLAPPSPTVTPSVTPSASPTISPVPSPSPTPNTNIANPSFELGSGTDPADPIIGWTRVAVKPYVARSEDQAYDGTYSCTFSSTGYVTDNYGDQGIRSDDVYSIIGGDDYDVGGWFYVVQEGGAITDTLFKFNIEWLSDGSVVSTDSDSDWSLAAFDTWENKEYRVTAPASADQVRIYIAALEDNNNNNNIYIDVFYVDHAPAITVTAPELNDAWYVNTVNTVAWDSYQVTGNIDIHYNTDGGIWTPIDTNIADTGSYPWTVPNDPNDLARVRVQETGGVGVNGTSDLFKIVERDTINISAPRGGETWYRTAVYNIVWTYGPDVGSGAVDLYYSTDNGGAWTLIDSGIAIGAGSYPWTIPDANSTNCLVRVYQSSSGTTGESAAVFTIASPLFTVTSPSGGEYWYYQDDEEITWTFTSGITGNVNVDYSTTGVAGPWYQIASNQSNTGSYSYWTIPNISTSTARVRISEIGGVSVPGISASDFTLKGLPVPQPYFELEWVEMPEIDTVCSLIAIEAFDANNVWVSCSCGLIYHWNGTTWALQGAVPANINEFVAFSADLVYGGGTGGTLVKYDGSDWDDISEPLGKTIYSLDGPDPQHMLAGASSGIYKHTENGGTTWTSTSVGQSGSLYGNAYLKPDEAYVMRKSSSTYNTTIFTPANAAWSAWSTFADFGGWGIDNHPLGGCISQYGETLLWAVGDCGTLDHYNGSYWCTQTQSGFNNFDCVEVLDENNVWAYAEGMIYRYTGSEWFIEAEGVSAINQFSAADSRHVFAVTSSKVYYTYAEPSPTPYWVTPVGYHTPTPTPVPVPGTISGRVYDRVTGAGVSDLYVRALPTESGLPPGGARTDSLGNYITYELAAGSYELFVDANSGSGVRVYRDQWYNQKDAQRYANPIGSGSTGIDFPLYSMGVYPTPVGAPTPDFQAIRVASGDYTGDGLSDITIFRPSSGLWAVRAVTRVYFGTSGDIPVSGDYDGDGTADVAVFRSSSALWAIRALSRAYYGGSSDIAVPGDYDGDGSCDIGIFRDSSGLWAVRGITRDYFGSAPDEPVPGDYDGDGEDDIAIFRGSSGLWAVRGISRVYYGSSADSVVPGDYGATGSTVPAIFRPSTGLWSIRGLTRVYFGSAVDQPVPFDYTGATDINIFRPSTGLWAVRGITKVYFGSGNDQPATR
jgi:hypothetical protein